MMQHPIQLSLSTRPEAVKPQAEGIGTRQPVFRLRLGSATVWFPGGFKKQCRNFPLYDEAERRIAAALRRAPCLPLRDVEREEKLAALVANGEYKSASRASDLGHEVSRRFF